VIRFGNCFAISRPGVALSTRSNSELFDLRTLSRSPIPRANRSANTSAILTANAPADASVKWLVIE
jgi:hypothetical protein